MKNLFYFARLNVIGGIEQFFAYLSQKYKDWDIAILYRTADIHQLNRLRKYAECIKFTGQTIECDRVFMPLDTSVRDFIKAKEYIGVLHGDYRAMINQGIVTKDSTLGIQSCDKIIGVSKTVCDGWKAVTGQDCELCYNPFIPETKKKKFLKLVYCGRLTSEKGGDLVQKLINRLDERNIDYFLYVYSGENKFTGKHIIYMGTRLDVCQFLNKDNFDYLIVSSKNEGYCYSLVQALSNGLPVVATPCPVFAELGVNAKNSITIDFDGRNLDSTIDQMLKKNLSFKYTAMQDSWDKFLAEGKSTYKPHIIQVKAVQKYFDLEFCEVKNIGDVFETTKERTDVLLKAGRVVLTEEK